MKKTSTIVKEKNTYEIDVFINNTAYIKSVTGKTGLLNIKTNQIIGDMDNYHTIYDTHGQFYYQEKTIEKSSEENNWTTRKTVRIFDALNERILVDGFEVVKEFSSQYDLTALKSPIDGKLHLFDKYACRKHTNIFDMPLDDIEYLFSEYNDTYLVVTVNGKKGLYYHNCYDKTPSLITPIEFDNIEKLHNIIVYTKNNQKYFECTGRDGKKSSTFDEIKLDDNNKNIAYCKKGNQIYAYNTEAQELLLSTDADEIKYMYKNGDSYNDYHGDFFFEIMKNGKYGVISSEINNEIRKAGTGAKVSTLLPPKYDEIERARGGLYLKKDGKIGLFIGNSYHNQVIEPKYDDIDFLGYNYFALYTNGLCDIGKATSYNPFTPSITNCEVAEDFDNALTYKKNGKYGLLFADDRHDEIIPPEYDSISNVAKYYFILGQNNKKGLMHLGKIIIPVEYDEISIGGQYGKYGSLKDSKVLYFALKKGKKHELAKLHNWQYVVTDVEFVSNHTFDTIDFFHDVMVFKDQVYSYIYDYNEKLLKSLPASTSITAYGRPYKDDYDKECGYRKYFYCIDGVYYYYKDGKFEEVYTENNDLYLTTYETEKDSFEIRSYNKDEHDSFCSTIDSQEDAEAEKSLIEMSEKGISRIDYPTLVLRRVSKKSNQKEKI